MPARPQAAWMNVDERPFKDVKYFPVEWTVQVVKMLPGIATCGIDIPDAYIGPSAILETPAWTVVLSAEPYPHQP